MIFTNGAKWKHQRSVLGSSFNFEKLKGRLPIIVEIVNESIKSVLAKKSERLNIYETFNQITGEVIIRTFLGEELMGVKINGQCLQAEIT